MGLVLAAAAVSLGLTSWVAAETPLDPGARARALLAEVARAGAPEDLTARPKARAEALLSRVDATAETSEQTSRLRLAALAWAELAHDLVRARVLEQDADRLQLEVSALQTEIARARAAVEQARARLGRAQRELSDIERAGKEAR